ncbi:MAG: FAD/NAD(P)-binding oxidoreductase [Sphingomonadales bacterium]|nr:MAG: FAD/NAD(P)-binding oxidoreductase [Sphingomonadales bacterium]
MPSRSNPDSPYDVAIIGGGVVGAAVARRFTLEGASVVLLEKGADILSGASKGNSAILHTGFDAPEGSLELACMQAGYGEYLSIREGLGLPLLETGALVVAWTPVEQAQLDGILQRAHANGVSDTRAVTAAQVRALEPGLADTALGAVLVPGEHLIDPWSAPLAYLMQAVLNGATVLRNCELLAGTFDGARWVLDTSQGPVRARHAINCAGLYGDVVQERLTGERPFEIKPRKGQFIVFDKIAHDLLKRIILPVPNERTKGVVLTRTVFGNLLVGPTAEEQPERDFGTVDTETLEQLRTTAIQIVPALQNVPVTAVYAGIRPATERKEYRVSHDPARNLIVAGGIRSTGLTAALGIAQHLFNLYAEAAEHPMAIAEPKGWSAPNLAEHCPRDWQSPGYGEIICHCEMVTRREIQAALGGPLPAGDIGGLKRRTRAGMGRCQGFYCNAAVARITAGRFADPLATGGRDD